LGEQYKSFSSSFQQILKAEKNKTYFIYKPKYSCDNITISYF
jgi:hypothetical protein